MIKQGSKPVRRRQRGAVALVLGLSLVVLIGFAGLAIDLGRFFVIKSELQNAVDACALAAVSQLLPGGGDTTVLVKAKAYGQLAASKNLGNFQSQTVAIADNLITFSDKIDFSTSANYNTAKYVKCSYPLSGLPVYFMQVLNPELGTQTVSASAVAAWLASSTSACAIPIGVCKAVGGTALNNYGYAVGEWVTAKSGSSLGRGFFGWIDFTKSGGGKSELISTLQGNGQCSPVTAASETGNKASVDDVWNSRFGYYDKLNTTNAPPDFTGYAYSVANWPSGSGAYTNYKTAKASYLSYQGNIPRGIDGVPSNKFHAAILNMGNTVARRVAKAPVMDCSNFKNDTPIQNWACVLMLNPMISTGKPKSPPDEMWDTAKVEFLGLASSAGSPCAAGGPALAQ